MSSAQKLACQVHSLHSAINSSSRDEHEKAKLGDNVEVEEPLVVLRCRNKAQRLCIQDERWNHVFIVFILSCNWLLLGCSRAASWKPFCFEWMGMPVPLLTMLLCVYTCP